MTVDLPSGVQHGTPEGYAHGCNKDRRDCPALTQHGMSCTIAHVRSMTDPRYFKAKTRDPRPAAIARYLGIHRPTPADIEYDAQHDRRRIEGNTMPKPTPPTNPRAKKPTTPPAPAVLDAPDQPHLALTDFTRGLSQSATRTRGNEIRAWLRTHGHPDLASRGVIPSPMLHEYLAAHPGATDPAQPLAERPHDPSDTTPPAHGDELAAATPPEAPAEGEGMGHPTEAELTEWAAELAHEALTEHGLDEHAPATAELIDQVRDRIDMPRPATPLDNAPAPRPEWAAVAISEDINNALAERDRARDTAARLWEQLEHAEQRARTAENALALALTTWATTTTDLELTQRNLGDVTRTLGDVTRTLRLVTRRGIQALERADLAEHALAEIRAAAEAHPGSTVTLLPDEGTMRGIRLTPPSKRRTVRWRNSR